MRCVVFELAGGEHIYVPPPPPAVRRWLRPPAVRWLKTVHHMYWMQRTLNRLHNNQFARQTRWCQNHCSILSNTEVITEKLFRSKMPFLSCVHSIATKSGRIMVNCIALSFGIHLRFSRLPWKYHSRSKIGIISFTKTNWYGVRLTYPMG